MNDQELNKFIEDRKHLVMDPTYGMWKENLKMLLKDFELKLQSNTLSQKDIETEQLRADVNYWKQIARDNKGINQ
jgi:hypothetical protein